MATVFEKNERHQEPVVSFFFYFMDIADDICHQHYLEEIVFKAVKLTGV